MRLWHLVNGCVDNSVDIDIVEWVVETVMAGSCVLDAGWRAAAAYQGEPGELGWPPLDHQLPITLRREHWEWVLEQLARWEPYEPGEAETFSEIRALIQDETHRRLGRDALARRAAFLTHVPVALAE